jgi:hypothetical protein
MPTEQRVRFIYVDAGNINLFPLPPQEITIWVAYETQVDKTDLIWAEIVGTEELKAGVLLASIGAPWAAKFVGDKKILGIRLASPRENITYQRCCICQEFINRNLLSMVGRALICQVCSSIHLACSKCDEWVKYDKASKDKQGQVLCPECTKLYDVCPNCGSWRSPRPDKKCPKCSSARSHSQEQAEQSEVARYRSGLSSQVHDYSHKPIAIFHPSKDNTSLFFGVELEVDDINNNELCSAKLVGLSNEENLFYLKYDGSIHRGFEIVTHPCTLEFHKEGIPWKDIKKICIALGGRSHETTTCGLHVHFNSNFFGKPMSEGWNINTLKLLNITNHFWRQIVKFSRREPADLQRWASRFYEDFKATPENTSKIEGLISGGVRHRAINITRPERTIEVRLFKGTLNESTIFATLEFLDFLLKWIKTSSVDEIYNLTWEKLVSYMDFVKYPELKEYLIRRKLCV